MSSPSVALEKGAYRMNAPPQEVHRHRKRITPPTQSRISAYMAVLIVVLTFATATCFGTAYYLFTTRWDRPTVLHPSTLADPTVVQVIPYNSVVDQTYPPDAKYLAYLPHSGFHNQRIAFENALTLSRILNRTLLIPPARLGNRPFRYVRSTALRQFLILGGKEGLEHCARVPETVSLPLECLDYFDFTHLSWEWLVGKQSGMVERWDMTDEWLEETLGIRESNTMDFQDTSAYHYRFLDTTEPPTVAPHKFSKHIQIDDLVKSKKRLVHLGTMFGTTRLYLKNKENQAVRAAVRKSMAFSNHFLVDAANEIAEALGGSYLGAHVRLGDGPFKDNATDNARLVWWKLVHGATGLSLQTTMALEGHVGGTIPIIPRDASALRVPHPPLPPLPEHSNLRLPCRGPINNEIPVMNTPLYISTDARDPETHPALAVFLKTFPCTFFLLDFPLHTKELKTLRNGWDGVPMESFLIPFVDGMVVARGWAAVGTPGSTFSRFVEDVLYRVAHGWDIVTRG